VRGKKSKNLQYQFGLLFLEHPQGQQIRGLGGWGELLIRVHKSRQPKFSSPGGEGSKVEKEGTSK